MKESVWEATRRRGKKKALVYGLFIVVLLAAATVLFLNNRDQFGPFGNRSTAQPTGRSWETGTLAADRRGSGSTPPQGVAAQPPEPVPVESQRLSPLPSEPAGLPPAAVLQPAVKDAPDVKKQALPETPRTISVELPSIPCRIESRKDVVIYLSLELFFTDITTRGSIMLRRDDIKVMVMRAVQRRELNQLTPGELERRLLQDINRLFERSDITAVKITNIQVGKVDK